MPDTSETASQPFPVVCLQCGCARLAWRMSTGSLDEPVCSACGYVGWRDTTVAELLAILEDTAPGRLRLAAAFGSA